MKFSLKAETRCDFYVDEKRKKIWKIQLDLLNTFVKFCCDNDIKVFGILGTMLGAVRHKGYIPWDDDIDIAMYRTEYNKLIKAINLKKPFKSPYFLQTATNDGEHYSTTMRFRYENSTGIIYYDKYKNCNNGIYIDIFVLDGVTDSKTKYAIQNFRLRYLNMLMRTKKNPSQNKNLINKLKELYSNLYFKIHSFEETYDKFERIAGMYSKTESKYINHLTEPLNRKNKNLYLWEKRLIDEVIFVDFENTSIPIPAMYDECLRSLYGNYMEFPPIEKRGTQHENIVIFDPDCNYHLYQKEHGWI